MSSSVGPIVTTSGLLVNFDPAVSLVNYTANLISVPENFTNTTWWSVANGTITPNTIIAPNGTLTGTLLTQTGASTAYLNFGNISITAGTTYTFSAYVKSASQSSVYILLYNTQFGSGAANVYSLFNLATVTASAAGGSPVSQTITPAGDGWFRISMTATANSTTSINAQFLRFADPGVRSTIYCWGAQIEEGSVATEYFPQSGNKSPTTWNNLITTPSEPNLTSVEVLVVAGGGAGAFTGSGGGAGGVLYNANFPVAAGTSYTATVGAGGFGAPFSNGQAGANSVFGSLTAFGGGGGVTHGTTGAGQNGGSGGGAAQVYTAGTSCNPGLGVDGQGFMGGQTPVGVNDWPGGSAGGGGAGGPGQRGGANIQGYGNGGIGRFFPQFASIGGSPAGWFGGGGGGGEVSHGFITEGGIGGGGTGTPDAVGSNGVANTGGGGAGGGYSGPYFQGGNGGSGIIIVRYTSPVRASGGTISISGDTVTHTFTSGTSSFAVINSSRIFNNNPTYSNLNGGFLTFNGTNQGISIPNSVLNTPYTGKTIIATARMNTEFGTGIFRGLVGSGTVLGNRNFNMYIYSDSTGYRIHFSFGPNSVFAAGFSNYLTTLALGQWFTAAVTQDTAGNVNCYLNGANVGTFTGVTFHQYIAGETEYIGRNDGLWYGDISQAKIYSRALTAAEILQNYQSIQSRFSLGGRLARYDGSSLSGWATLGVTVNAVTGNAAPSFYVNAGQYGYIAPTTITSFANTTITFDVNITSAASLCNLFFAANSGGMGTMLRLEGRTGTPSGFMAPTNWNSWEAGPSGGPTLAASTWYNIKIQINSVGFATWYLNGALQSSTASVRLLGNYIGIHGDGAGTGAYFDNIIVYSGIV